MFNLFKTRFLPNADGTESTTALTNANTVFIHTYLGDDSTGDGTREKPYRSMNKALLRGLPYILFRGLINEAFTAGQSYTIVGDDINQIVTTLNFLVLVATQVRTTTSNPASHNGQTSNSLCCIVTENHTTHTNGVTDNNCQYLGFLFLKTFICNGILGTRRQTSIAMCTMKEYLHQHIPSANRVKNCIAIRSLGLVQTGDVRNFVILASTYVYHSTTNTNRAIIPKYTNDSSLNVQKLRDSLRNLSNTTIGDILYKDQFNNETCKIIYEQRCGGTHPNVFNKYAPNLTGKLNAAVTIGAKTSVTINVADANQWPATGDLFMPTETAYTANGVTMPIGSFEVWSYTSVTIVSPTRITLNGPSYTFKTAHSDLNKDCTRYGDVLDFTLNPDPLNEALWASDTGGYVGCFRPAYACDVETGLSAISNVDENGTDSGSGDLLQIVNGELKFNSASSQLWNRMSDITTINIPNGSNFKGLNAMSQDGSPFGYYIGKKQTLISPTAIAAGNALTVGKWYKVYNDNGNSVSEAILYNGVRYLPEYTFLCVTGVTTFSESESGSGSYVKEILSGVLESIEILPYNDMTTPSTFPKFSAPLMGECKLIFYTASGAARYGKTVGDPVKFADLDLANMLTDFGTVKNKISYYDTWAISNADSEFYLLTNAGLSTTLKGYFTQGIPAIKYLRREINGHFDQLYN